MKKLILLLAAFVASMVLAGCGGGSSSSSNACTAIYTSAFPCNGLSTSFVGSSTTPTSLSCVITTAGASTATTLSACKNPNITLTGYLYDSTKAASYYEGTVIQATTTANAGYIGAGNYIAGFDEGLIGMKVGETRVLLIPSNLAYGSSSTATIPANSPLVFVVTLNSIS